MADANRKLCAHFECLSMAVHLLGKLTLSRGRIGSGAMDFLRVNLQPGLVRYVPKPIPN